MKLVAFRKSLGLSQEALAIRLGLKPTCKSWISDIENDKREPSLKLALKIEALSEGKVSATSLNSVAAEIGG